MARIQSDAVIASVVTQAAQVAPTPEVTKPAAVKAASKVKTLPRQPKANQAATLGVMIGEVGETLGNLSVMESLDRTTAALEVEATLRAAMKAGLTCDKESATGDMLKAPSAKNPGELWTIFVDAINAPRIANELPEIATSARDNYLTRIRAFVRARGVQPLDLYGNLAHEARKAAGLVTAKTPAKTDQIDPQGDADPVNVSAHVRNAETSYAGATPLLHFLQQWTESNDAEKSTAAFAAVINMANDLQSAVEEFIAAQTAKKSGKGKAEVK